MAKNYYTLEPDRIYLMRQNPPLHFNVGRGGAKIEFVTRHHLMMVGEVEAVVDRVWNTRPASAHVVIGPRGRWGQSVWDKDTAWGNANVWANQRTIVLEHSNNTGRFGTNDYHDKSWNISDETLISGARVAAAYCLERELGSPVYGRSIRDHNEFTSTGCPVHLQGPRPGNAWGGKAGKYHHPWMEEATWFYGQLEKRLVLPDGTPITPKFTPPKKEEGPFMALNDAEQRELLTKTRQIHDQLGPWPQLGKNDKGQDLTLIDAVADSRRKAGHTKEEK